MSWKVVQYLCFCRSQTGGLGVNFETFISSRLYISLRLSNMKGKIILEEHVCMPEQDNQIARFDTISHSGSDLFRALVDLHDNRLKEMDANGVEFAIISQNPSGPQGIHDASEAEKFATKSNEYVAELVGRRPERFGAFACLSMHDPTQAAAELARCVAKLGMFGAMLHGGQEYKVDEEVKEWQYDEPKYDVFWAKVQELGVPIYLHPKSPLPRDMDRLYKNRPWLVGPVYSFARDCSFQVMALCTSGLFDRYPGVKIILGHMGKKYLNRSFLRSKFLTLDRRDDSQSFGPDGSLVGEKESRT